MPKKERIRVRLNEPKINKIEGFHILLTMNREPTDCHKNDEYTIGQFEHWLLKKNNIRFDVVGG